jgi:hypothetical protein
MEPTMTVHPRLQRAELRRVFGAFPTGVTALGVTVLAAHQEQLGRALAARGGDRFAGASWPSNEHGAIVLDADPLVPPLIFHRSAFGRLHTAA